MTTQATPLNYAGPMPKSGSVPRFLVPAVAVAVGILGANSFADAAGFPVVLSSERERGYIFLRILCGIVVAVLAAAVVVTTMRLVRVVSVMLAETRGRPAMAVLITLIACGTMCILGALAIPLYLHHSSSASISVSMQDASVSLSQPSFLTVCVTIFTIAAGTALIGIGIWGSLRSDATVAN